MVLNLDELLEALATNSPIPTNKCQRKTKSSKSKKPRKTRESKESDSTAATVLKATPAAPARKTATTKSACERFFELPELITCLINTLTYPQLSAFMQLNKYVLALTLPAFYRNVDLSGVRGVARSDDIPAIQALGRNTRHVRYFRTDIMFGTLYINSIAMALAEAHKRSGVKEPIRLPSTSIRMPKPLESMPFTPMSNLTRLHLSMDTPYGAEDRAICGGSAGTHKERTSQLSWILHWSPLITDLKLTYWQIPDYTQIQDLPLAISRLSKLKVLKFWLAIHRRHWHHFASTMYHCTSSTLEKLCIEFIDMADMMEPTSHLVGHIYADAAAERIKSRRGNAGWEMVPPRRQGSLSKLKVLAAPALLVDKKEGLTYYLEQSPELEFLSIPQLDRSVKVNEVLRGFMQHCPKLHSIAGSEIQMEQVAKVIPGLMLLMPEQRLQGLFWAGFKEDPATDYRTLFKRHSTTIQRIHMNLCRGIGSKTIQAILYECSGLEEFVVLPHSYRSSTKIDLVDAIVGPWVCTRLKKLVLTVAFPDIRPIMAVGSPTIKPYYDRSEPFFLTSEEREQFAQLEKLYTNIGSLTKIEELTLYAKPIPPATATAEAIAASSSPEEWWIRYRYFSFPGLLSLGDKKTGCPGYLHLLKGLTNLQQLMGSVAIDNKDTIKTVWWEEIEFMDKHFPKLMKTEFLQFGKATATGTSWHAPIAWLLKRRPGFLQSMYGMPSPQRSGC
ncbi:MAG: hypothetical protein JOS17DRAFT_732226 [Linnemannia elongata]|nr:MAG: hypothetical protein JOS17DRAFT_732226 [Linnemannia elongata]